MWNFVFLFEEATSEATILQNVLECELRKYSDSKFQRFYAEEIEEEITKLDSTPDFFVVFLPIEKMDWVQSISDLIKNKFRECTSVWVCADLTDFYKEQWSSLDKVEEDSFLLNLMRPEEFPVHRSTTPEVPSNSLERLVFHVMRKEPIFSHLVNFLVALTK